MANLIDRISSSFVKKKETHKEVKNLYEYKRDVSNKFKIVEMPKARVIPSIDNYITAVEGAQSKLIQNRVLLYDNYLTTLTFDNHVKSLMDKRLDNVGNRVIQMYYQDKPYEDANYFLKAPEFEQFMKDIVLTKFWGMNLFEFTVKEYEEKMWFDYNIIPHKHINPYSKEVLTQQFSSEGVNWEGYDDVLFCGDENDLGLLLQITLLSLYRRLGNYNYAKYVDLASDNFEKIKARGVGDDDSWERIQEQLSEKQGGSSIFLPEGVDLDSENRASSQQNQLFEGYMQMLKDELAILILGQTMTTEDGSSRAQAVVHQDEQDMKYTADEEYVLNVLNYEFKDYLHLWGWDLDKKQVSFKFIPSTDEELRRKLANYKTLKELGVMFTDEELRETFKEII